MRIAFVLLIISASIYSESLDFMQQARKKAMPLVKKILEHPFLIDMANGTLSTERFQYFSVQDNIYCWRYSDALHTLARKTLNYTEKQFFMNAAMASTQEWGGVHPEPVEPCPSCQAYSDFEFRSAEDSYGTGIAAITPCYTIYWEVRIGLNAIQCQITPISLGLIDTRMTRISKNMSKYWVNLRIELLEIAARLSNGKC